MTALASSGPRPVKVFISYATADSPLAERAVAFLEFHHGISCFLAPRDIKQREDWRQRLDAEIRDRDLVLLIYTPHSAQSKEVRYEIETAQSVKTPIWMIKNAATRLDEYFGALGFARRQAFLLHAAKEAECFAAIVEALNREWNRINPDAVEFNPDDCPYPGYESYDKSRTRFFCGRRDDCIALGDALYDEDNRIFLVYGPSGIGKTSLLTVGLTGRIASGDWLSSPIRAAGFTGGEDPAEYLFRASLEQLNGEPSSVPEIVEAVRLAVNAKQSKRCILCFDQSEELFRQENRATEIDTFLRQLLYLLGRCPTLRVILCFREEYLASVEKRITRLGIDCRKWPLRKLSPKDAIECMIEPAKACGVEFDPVLAEALAEVLAKVEGWDAKGNVIRAVESISIQLVCTSLWEKGKSYRRIHRSLLPDSGGDTRRQAALFVHDVLDHYLDRVIEKIAERQCAFEGVSVQQPIADATSKKTQWVDFIELSLVQFVAPGQKRQRVPETRLANGERRVGRLSGTLVDELVNRRLVHKCEDFPEYELVHDFLAETVDKKYRGKVKLLPPLNILESTLRNVAGAENKTLSGYFNANATLLKDLEEARRNNLHFWEDEAEFLVRCALGDQRRHVAGPEISVTGWAEMLGNSSPDALMRVLADGLATDPRVSDAVRLDVIDLLRAPSIQEQLGSARLSSLAKHLRELATSASMTVREAAASALLELNEEAIGDLFKGLEVPGRRDAARTAVYLLRHAVDTAPGSAGERHSAFNTRWAALAPATRLRILAGLLWFRTRESFAQIAYIVALTAPVTAFGAALPFAPCGFLGASPTLENASLGVFKGLFHGILGGLMWGTTVSAALLTYCVIWRGGRVRKGFGEYVRVFAAGILGGTIGGILNTAGIAFIYTNSGLFNAGWTSTLDFRGLGEALRQIVLKTRHALILPIFGATLGAGIAWSLLSMLHDRSEKWAGTQNSIAGIREASRLVGRIAGHVVRQSWRNALLVGAGAGLVLQFVVPGPGVCDPSAALHDAGCVQAHPHLMSFLARITGMGVIILVGSLFLETGFLSAVVSARLGVEIRKNREFLRLKEERREDSPAPVLPAGQ